MSCGSSFRALACSRVLIITKAQVHQLLTCLSVPLNCLASKPYKRKNNDICVVRPLDFWIKIPDTATESCMPEAFVWWLKASSDDTGCKIPSFAVFLIL